MQKPKWLSIIIILLTFLTTGCSSIVENSPTEIYTSADPTFQFDQGMEARGKIILSHQLDLSFTISGNVVELLVEEGDRLNQGDMIARLDTKLLEQENSIAEADLKAAKANLERVLAGPSNAEIIQGENDLIAAQAIGPLPEEVAIAQADVDRAQTRVDSADARLEGSVLYAPINGTVLEVFVHAYEYAGTGQPVVRLSDLNDLSVEVLMDELDVVGLSIGDEVPVTFEALPGITTQAVIISFSPNLDINDSRDFKVKLKLLDVPENLRWGMTAEVSFKQ
jgi:RND family efflux transporter MFP subunit